MPDVVLLIFVETIVEAIVPNGQQIPGIAVSGSVRNGAAVKVTDTTGEGSELRA